MAIQSIGTNSILNNLNISNTTEEKTIENKEGADNA